MLALITKVTLMRYIGNKRNLIDDIESFIRKHVPESLIKDGVFLDLFAGVNSVAMHFKRYMPVITNDSMYFSYVLARGMVTINTPPDFSTLNANIAAQDVLDYLNNLPVYDLIEGFIANNYTLHDSDREYLSAENGKRVDTIRHTVEEWHTSGLIDEDGYYYLLACLIRAISKVSNTRGSYAAFLKDTDVRSLQPLMLTHPILLDNHRENKAYCSDAIELLSTVSAHICYIDPPYSQQQYSSNYHLLETVCMNDIPLIKGKTGVRQYNDSQKSKFCSTVYATQTLYRLIEACQSPHIIISYTSRGIITSQEIRQALAQFCDPSSIVMHEFDYHTYKGGKVKSSEKNCEYLFYAHKPDIVLPVNTNQSMIQIDSKPSYSFHQTPSDIIPSPINYQDNQYEYLDQVLALIPTGLDDFLDVFSGGMSVSMNVDATKVYVNDLKTPIIEMLEYLAVTSIDELMVGIQRDISKYGLSRINTGGFLRLRADYNKHPTPLGLYLLICHSYNNQFRFNSKGIYNAYFGRNRSFFSERLKRELITYSHSAASKNLVFSSSDYRVLMANTLVSPTAFYYCHPPSLLLLEDFIDLEAGFPLWCKESQIALYKSLDKLTEQGIRFLLIGVTSHKGDTDGLLIEWAERYNQKIIEGDIETQRVAIMNY